MEQLKYPCYVERKDAKGEWYWVYYSRNGESIARSSESYHRRADCTHAIGLLKASADHPVFEG